MPLTTTSVSLYQVRTHSRARPVSRAPGSALTKNFGTVVVTPVWARNTVVAAKQLADWHGAVLAKDTLASNVSVQRSAWSQHRNTSRRLGHQPPAVRTVLHRGIVVRSFRAVIVEPVECSIGIY